MVGAGECLARGGKGRVRASPGMTVVPGVKLS